MDQDPKAPEGEAAPAQPPAAEVADSGSPHRREPGAASAPGPRQRLRGLTGALTSRGTRWGTATAAYVVVVAAILVAVNLVGSRITTTWDLTAGHQLTLSAASRRIAAHLQRPVRIIAFIRPGGTTGAEIGALLRQYARYARGKLTYQLVNPVSNNGLAARYGVTAYDTVVVQSGNNIQTVQPGSLTTYNASGSPVFSGEGAITNAILRAGVPVTLRVDWLSGDGEPDINAGRRPGATSALSDAGYHVGTLNLLTTRGVPADVAALIVDSPTHDLAPSEITALRAYAARGGHLVFLLGPTLAPLSNLDALLHSWGITPQNDVVIDTARHFTGDPTAVVPLYGSSSITAPLRAANLAVLLPGSQSLALGHPKGYTLKAILTTSPGSAGGHPASWGMVNSKALLTGQISYTPGKDIPGPLTLAATAQWAKTPSTRSALGPEGAPGFRAVVFGNSAFISSGTTTGGQGGFITVQGNQDLFVNAVSWATGLTQGITVRPKSNLNTQVLLTAQTGRSLVLTFIVAVPLACFLLAFGTWLSRRRL